MLSTPINSNITKVTCILVSTLATIVFGADSAQASCGNNHIKAGLGLFSSNSFNCETDRQRDQTCYKANARTQSTYLFTAKCVLKPKWMWREPKSFDFRINVGLSSHIVKLSIDNGSYCFDARNGANGNTASEIIYFCESSKTSPFTKNEVEALLKNKSKFGLGGNSYKSSQPQQKQSATQSSKSSSASKIDKAKSTCTELGFTAGTEKHGQCVLKLLDN